MTTRLHAHRVRAARPVLEGLESRALLSTMHKAIVPTIAQLATARLQTATTIPSNGDVNPYGVTFVPQGFAKGGPLNPGDVLVGNFNNGDNLQGTGTTVVRITPAGTTSLFYQGPPGIGLTNGLSVLKRGFVLVGAVPTTDGTPNTVGQGEILVLDRNGNLVTQLSDPALLNGPWSLTVHDNGSRAQIYVSNVLSGTVTRIDLSVPSSGTAIKVLASTQIASGYTHRGDAGAIELGPAGLVFDAKSQTLYVASSGDDAVYAIHNASRLRSDHGTGTLIYQDTVHLHGPVGLTFAPDGNLIVANSDGNNADPNQPSELVEFTRRGKFIGQFSINENAGGAFGVAVRYLSKNKALVAAVNDVTNQLEVWQVRY